MREVINIHIGTLRIGCRSIRIRIVHLVKLNVNEVGLVVGTLK